MIRILVINLECPLTDSDISIEKNGPNLKAILETITGIKALNPSVVGLANNHIMDFGEKGLLGTLNILSQNQIPYIGVGKNQEEASISIHIVE